MLTRLATAADIAQIVELVNLAFRVEAFMVYGDRTNAAQIKTMFGTGVFLLGEISGELAGCVYLELRGERAYFGLLSISPAHQRQGVGRKLADEAERRAKAAGCRAMDLRTVNVRPELTVIYSKMGYAESGTEPFPAEVPTKMPCHFVRMSKNLV